MSYNIVIEKVIFELLFRVRGQLRLIKKNKIIEGQAHYPSGEN